MKNATKMVMSSVAALALIGCGDSYSDKIETEVPTAPIVGHAELKTLDREVKYLTDTDAMSLYIFDKDMLNTSNCDAECQQIWPLFEGADSGSEDIKVLEGTDHLAYRKHPLYYFVNDKAPGDILGNNVKDVWHLVFAPEGSTDTQTALSDTDVKQTYLTDKDGRSLYTFDKDTTDVSNCYDTTPTSGEGCETIWPVFSASDLGILPTGTSSTDFGVIDRDETRAKEGEPLTQVTYKGKPLYYFAPDAQQSGETKGDWVKGVWHLVELTSEKIGTTPTTSPYTAEAAAKGEEIFTDPAKCASCHGADGQTPPLGVDNVIARYGDAALITQKLKDMRDNGNPQNRNGAMVSIAQNLSDEAIINLSAFIATLKK